MTELLERLNQDHRHLSRLLNLFDALLDRFHEGNEPDFELMCEMLEYMESYADQVHHPSEEMIFDRLRARSNETYPVLDILTKPVPVELDMAKLCLEVRVVRKKVAHLVLVRCCFRRPLPNFGRPHNILPIIAKIPCFQGTYLTVLTKYRARSTHQIGADSEACSARISPLQPEQA